MTIADAAVVVDDVDNHNRDIRDAAAMTKRRKHKSSGKPSLASGCRGSSRRDHDLLFCDDRGYRNVPHSAPHRECRVGALYVKSGRIFARACVGLGDHVVGDGGRGSGSIRRRGDHSSLAFPSLTPMLSLNGRGRHQSRSWGRSKVNLLVQKVIGNQILNVSQIKTRGIGNQWSQRDAVELGQGSGLDMNSNLSVRRAKA